MTWVIIGCVLGFAVLLCFLLAVANFAGERFLERYEEVDQMGIENAISTNEFFKQMNSSFFGNKLACHLVTGKATDAYSKGALYLSEHSRFRNSIASFTIIAHELGHALQDKTGKKLKTLSKLRLAGRVLGTLFAPIMLAGGILCIMNYLILGFGLLAGGVTILILALFVKLRTISIEKEASKNALIFLEEIMNEEELKESKKFLADAKLTYWADFLRMMLWWTGLSRQTKMFN